MEYLTNVYLIVDCSVRNKSKITQIQNSLIRLKRAVEFSRDKAKIHIIGYHDTAKEIKDIKALKPFGNPNASGAFEMLNGILNQHHKNGINKTRSVFIWYTSDSVLEGYKTQLNGLFKEREFAFGLRYVVTVKKPDEFLFKAVSEFVDTKDKILPYFSESRLTALIKALRHNSKAH
ncbi:MAG: hypothetical protein MJ066_01830 [Clostridia bacterium]|nr:hypothetical protein [Clostridia bacterium]